MSQQNVVAFAAQTSARQVALPAQIGPLHKLLQRYLHARLSALFISADSQFCKLSEQSVRTEDCEAYLDIAQELRRTRSSIAGRQFQTLRAAFQQLHAPEDDAQVHGLRALDSDSIGLLSEEQQEIEVAVRTMVSKLCHADHCVAYEHLTTRVAALFRHNDVSKARNPFGGQILCESFVDACEMLEIPIRPRLMLFRLYEKHVLNDLGTLYEEANDWLKEQGVLPGLKGSKKTQDTAERPRAPDADSTDESSPLRSKLQALLRELPADAPADGSNSAALLDLVSSVQAAQAKGWLTADVTPSAEQDQLSGLLKTVEELAREEQGLELSRIERDVFKLVGLLFNYMCDDQELPQRFKPLFSKLQLPVLKAALVDRGFFTHAEHPARQLLEKLSQLCVGLEARAEQERAYRLLAEQIERLVNDLSASTELFAEVVAAINRFAAREERRAALLEQRLKAAEAGQARTEQAKNTVAASLNALLERYPAPALVETLLRGGWQQYLVLCLLKEGEQSAAFVAGLETAQQLLWSLQPKSEASERKQLLSYIPKIRRALRTGLEAINYDALATQRFFTALEPLHKQALRAQSRPQPAPRPASEEIRAEALRQAEAPTDIPQAPPEASPKPATTADSTALAPLTPAMESLKPEESRAVDAVDPQWQACIDQLQPGSWVEFRAASGDFRAKLAAYLRPTDRFIFVNRNGSKVAELSRRELIDRLQQGTVVLLEDAQLFDRALESIISNLRHPH